MICEVDVWPTLALMEVAHILASVASPSLNRNDVYPVHQTNLKLNRKLGTRPKKIKDCAQQWIGHTQNTLKILLRIIYLGNILFYCTFCTVIDP